jgi:hypothetical protein
MLDGEACFICLNTMPRMLGEMSVLTLGCCHKQVHVHCMEGWVKASKALLCGHCKQKIPSPFSVDPDETKQFQVAGQLVDMVRSRAEELLVFSTEKAATYFGERQSADKKKRKLEPEDLDKKRRKVVNDLNDNIRKVRRDAFIVLSPLAGVVWCCRFGMHWTKSRISKSRLQSSTSRLAWPSFEPTWTRPSSRCLKRTSEHLQRQWRALLRFGVRCHPSSEDFFTLSKLNSLNSCRVPSNEHSSKHCNSSKNNACSSILVNQSTSNASVCNADE